MSHTKIVSIVAAALLTDRVLHAGDVTAGRGVLVDWRTVRSGEAIELDASDAFTVARLFVVLVGARQAVKSCRTI